MTTAAEKVTQTQNAQKQIDYLLSPLAIRERTAKISELAAAGKTHFRINPEKLDLVADYVLAVIRENYPDLRIPFHSRQGHLNAGGRDRVGSLEKTNLSPREIAKSKIELVVTSVLLDAGAGDNWKYLEPGTSDTYIRSEGLAVASFHMFTSGAFSNDKNFPWRADAEGLGSVTPSLIEKYFQVSGANPLTGVEGRAHLLRGLALGLKNRPDIFKNQRVGDLLDFLLADGEKTLSAPRVLDFVLRVFGDIWPSRLRLAGQNLGDVWSHSALGAPGSFESLVPFHKLSQWLTYSLLVPIAELGVEITDVDDLTGLAEYRNGGLLLDLGLLELRDKKHLSQAHAPQTDLVIEWRALTVVWLEKIAVAIRKKLNLTREELPLAKVLEGGTWHAGRKIAREKRPGGGPPLAIVSDGTVF
jgi:hypothetical protein